MFSNPDKGNKGSIDIGNDDSKAGPACQSKWAIQEWTVDIPSRGVNDARRFKQPLELRVAIPWRSINPDSEQPSG